MLKFLLSVVFVLISFSTSAQIREISLGSVRVENFQTDLEIKDFHDICQVTSVRAVVRKEKAEIDWIEIIFRDPTPSERFKLNLTLREDQSTPQLQLRGRGRCIGRIVMSARSRGSVWKDSKIELFATIDSFPAPHVTHPNGRDLTLVGEMSLNNNHPYYIPTQRGQECGIEAVRIQALSEGANLYRITLRFDDGSMQDLPVPSRLFRNTETAWIRLAPDRRGRGFRCITDFMIDGRTDSYGPNPSRIRIIGHRPR